MPTWGTVWEAIKEKNNWQYAKVNADKNKTSYRKLRLVEEASFINWVLFTLINICSTWASTPIKNVSILAMPVVKDKLRYPIWSQNMMKLLVAPTTINLEWVKWEVKCKALKWGNNSAI